MDFQHSPKAQEYIKRVSEFMKNEIDPIEESYLRELHSLDDKWVVLPIIEELKAKAKAAGLWNLFFPNESHGVGLTNLEYAPLAEIMGRSFIASEIFNCNAPDTGNMEVLEKYGTAEQQEKWLKPLMAGEIRSAFCMTEPGVASSDATNMEATAIVEGDEVVLNGRKWWTTGIGHPNCKVGIFMGLTNPEAHRHQQHSMVLFDFDTPGVKIERMLPVFGHYDEPFGHGEMTFDNVRVPLSNMIAGPGRGFEIAQGRLGPGRIHHCMRLIGGAEKALELMCKRAVSRTAFGKPIANLGGNRDIIANARMSIEQARLLVLKAAWIIDKVGVMAAMSEISQIKVIAPNIAQQICDAAMQIHGGGGLSDDFPLTGIYAQARALRLADGPDEVHRGLVAKFELMKYRKYMAEK
ncbi:MAG: acyl-CoA dehydrogenase family protein [Thalassolituus sp.]|jgi:alkylation response protein AidB-like acyl-CoA dehydrogenase|uniref:Acyl-CoA dehydrogenase n=2 Tax=root TaxID=1 RepID=M5DN33_9GAMM|nr:acyl-CoA dehydrogenase family protein [Thalassolituus oleivorans]PCI50165.1 MAG: acyl-CoA dehydrogenase [Oceanospirillales bacterium]AHK14615.1 acyl-CoA dehydrogenase [Thalassolituus oleivorans R6-15]APR65577.1 acyl-CoA dehydrogenase [Thalassolituus oleivorans]MBQ0725932.1 acyl-CoA dehydrogenase family protein [Thalassolituus oleivorans]MBQ0780845.1 acyl-CoA dehydrogenase family protein [Thalassolituus oleivorans]